MAQVNQTLFAKLKDRPSQIVDGKGLTHSLAVRVVIIVLACIGIAICMPGVTGTFGYGQEGKSWIGTTWTKETVTALFSFPVFKDAEEIATDRQIARLNSPPVFKSIPDFAQKTISNIDAKASGKSAAIQLALTKSKDGILRAITSRLHINGQKENQGDRQIVIIDDAVGKYFFASTTEFKDSASLAQQVTKLFTDLPTDLREQCSALVMNSMVFPYQYDLTGTRKLQEDAIAGVSTTSEIVAKGTILAKKGTRLSAKDVVRLGAYRLVNIQRSDVPFTILATIGSIIFVAFLVLFVVLYLYILRPVSFYRNGQLASLLSFLVIAAGMGWVSVHYGHTLPLEYIILIPAISMIVTVLYEVRTALLLTVAMSFVIGAVRGDDYSITVIMMFGGVLAVYSSRNIHSRTQIFTSILSILGGLLVTTLVIDMQRSTELSLVWPKLIFATVNAVVSPLLTFAAIILLEKVFNVATDLRLEEFNNINHPLLKQLNERAPGTYQHTMNVVRLSEAAAADIGANQLLARVGALFHDIGKIEKSEYFVENQLEIGNKHDKIAPKKSASIIRQHVQDGIELAKEYSLPERIWKFIPTHHGTVMIKHFYAKAVEEALLKEAVIDEQDFRYLGPIPDSKETGIVMLADAAEALSRLVNTSNRDEVEAAVEAIIIDRVLDGQLSNTPLTLADLDRIKESLVKNLLGSTHKRIQYKPLPTSSSDSSS